MSEQECVLAIKDGRLKLLRSGVVRFRGLSRKTGSEETYQTAGNLRLVAEAGRTMKELLARGSTGTAAQRCDPVHLDVLSDYERDLAASIGPADMIIFVRCLRTTDSVPLAPSFTLQETERLAEAMIEAARAADEAQDTEAASE
jgi:hypothetical protein